MTEFEFERGEILTNLTLLEDHAQKFQCPYCMEKHLSKIVGYAEEVAMGKEGDEKEMEELAEFAREWRRKIQGAKEHSHEHHEDIRSNPGPRRRYLPYGLTKCELSSPSVRRKLSRCIKKVEIRCCGKPTSDYSGCSCNPVAVCRASIPCP